MHETVARAPKQLCIAGIWRDAPSPLTGRVEK